MQAPNGWGKTTLLEAIAGLIPLTRGIIRLMGRPIQNLPVWERVNLSLSFLQARDNIFPSLTVREVLRLAQVKEIPQNISALLEQTMSNLSGGEKQKVVFGCILNGKAFAVGMLDEPFSALDRSLVRHSQDLLLPFFKNHSLMIVIPSQFNDSYP